MMFFDCCCSVGPRRGKDPEAPWSAEDVLKWMDLVGIDAALVSHTLMESTDPVKARERLAEDLSVAPDRLFPVWGVLPQDARDIDETPDDLLDRMRASNCAAVELWPKAHRYPFVPELLAPVVAPLQEAGVLTIVPFPELPSDLTAAYGQMDAFLGAFPHLPVLLKQPSWAFQRLVTALMDRHENLLIEFSTYQINRGLETYTERFGAERLLFGTGLPAMSAGAARAYVDYADLKEADRCRIAGENLVRFLGLKPGEAPKPEPDALRDVARRGKPLEVTVWDAHCHMLADGQNGEGPTVMYKGDAAGQREVTRRIGVDRTAIMTWNGPIGSDIRSNDIVSRAVEQFPDHYLGVCYINPVHDDADTVMGEVSRRVEKDGYVGLKPYVYDGPRYDADCYEPFWRYADEKGLYVLCHIGASTGGTDAIDNLARTYLNTQWIIAHTGGSFGMARQVAALMKEHYNVWAELTLTPVTNGVIEWMAGEVGDERILFGTDAPMRDPRPQFGWVVYADLPVESRKRILGENFKRMLKM